MELSMKRLCTIICLALVLDLNDAESTTGQLAHLVSELQTQVNILQREHSNDQQTIRELERLLASNKATAAATQDNGMENLESQLKELRRSLNEIVKTPVGKGADVADIRTETEILRSQLQGLRQEVSSLKARQEESSSIFGQMRATQITTKWLQRKVDEMRSEIREVAAVLNVSSGLNQLQNLDSNLDLLKSDFRALRRDYDQLVASQERENAGLNQVKQDTSELREIIQKLAMNHQKLAEQVQDLDSIKQKTANTEDTRLEFENTSKYNTKDLPETDDRGSSRYRHHRRVRAEISGLTATVKTLKSKQIQTDRETKELKTNYRTLKATVQQLKTASDRLRNQSSSLQTEQNLIRHRVNDVLDSVSKMEDRTGKNSAAIINMTETAGGVDKLHSSTMQLFEALESIEGEYGKDIAELQKEVSKLEFNVAQMQSSFQAIRQEQTNHRDMLKTLKKDMSLNQLQSQKNHIEITLLQTELLNHTLQSCKAARSTELQSRVRRLEGRLDRVYAELRLKVDADATNQWKEQQNVLREEFKKMNIILPSVEEREANLEMQMEKFIRRLPRDCSSMDKKSGVQLLHIPGLTDPKEVFCDADTSGGGWTVIQRRKDGSVQFDRKWKDYKVGFGNPDNEYWLGLEALHLLSNLDNFTLRIDMWDTFGRYKYVSYDTFFVMSEHDGYRLAVGGYKGNASNALEYHNSMEFSTSDHDRDGSNTNCALYYSSGWWYNHCQFVNINGKYKVGLTWYDIDSHEWTQLDRVEMKIRPRR